MAKNTRHLVPCPDCGIKRDISYRALWAIRSGKNSGRCQKCAQAARHAHLASIAERTCTFCGATKPIVDFPRRQGKFRTTAAHCKACDNARAGEYYRDHKEQCLAYAKEWAKQNAEKRRSIAANWSARARAGTDDYVDLVAVMERDAGHCYICDGAILDGERIAFDHVIPLSRGGTHTAENVRLTHYICNARKGPRLIEEMR